jgi:hypothetical protein
VKETLNILLLFLRCKNLVPVNLTGLTLELGENQGFKITFSKSVIKYSTLNSPPVLHPKSFIKI